MDAKVTWDKDMSFIGLAASGFPVRLSSPSGPEVGAGPVEVTLMALAACTAMDVLSILQKKQEIVTAFEVRAHAERADTYPKAITSAALEYVVTGTGVREESLLRAIELSIRQYCPVHAMLSQAFPIELSFSILETATGAAPAIVRSGHYPSNSGEEKRRKI